MKKGKVKFYNSEKGFGFILDSETNEDVFVHKTGLIGRIQDEDEVEFETEMGQKGVNAINVKRVN